MLTLTLLILTRSLTLTQIQTVTRTPQSQRTQRLRAENARLDADKVALLAAHDGDLAAYITASIDVERRRPDDDEDAQWQGDVAAEEATDSPFNARQSDTDSPLEAEAEAEVEEEREEAEEAEMEKVEEVEEVEVEEALGEEGWVAAQDMVQKEEEAAMEPTLAPEPAPAHAPTTRSALKRKPTLVDCPCPKRPCPAKKVRPALQPPHTPATPTPASYAAASSSLRPNQRIRVWWDNQTYFDGRVIDTRSELGRGGTVQQRFQVAYDDGEQRWHTADAVRVEMLAEELCMEAVCDEWLPLELR